MPRSTSSKPRPPAGASPSCPRPESLKILAKLAKQGTDSAAILHRANGSRPGAGGVVRRSAHFPGSSCPTALGRGADRRGQGPSSPKSARHLHDRRWAKVWRRVQTVGRTGRRQGYFRPRSRSCSLRMHLPRSVRRNLKSIAIGARPMGQSAHCLCAPVTAVEEWFGRGGRLPGRSYIFLMLFCHVLGRVKPREMRLSWLQQWWAAAFPDSSFCGSLFRLAYPFDTTIAQGATD